MTNTSNRIKLNTLTDEHIQAIEKFAGVKYPVGSISRKLRRRVDAVLKTRQSNELYDLWHYAQCLVDHQNDGEYASQLAAEIVSVTWAIRQEISARVPRKEIKPLPVGRAIEWDELAPITKFCR